MASLGPSPLPGVADEDRPPDDETDGQRRAVQALAIATLGISAVYLVWRALYTLGSWWVSVPMLVLEIHATIGLALFTLSLWELRATPTREAGSSTPPSVAVLIATYDEPEEVLLPTIAGAVALSQPHRTIVLDDGNRDWVRELCERLGAQWLTRPDNQHAKAGNLNHAIGILRDSIDVVAVLDADHVPTSNFLAHTLDYFNDPDVALVQTPQSFYNAGSFEHAANRSLLWPSRRSARYNEQALFYRGIQAGKNRWNASFWCGTNALLRVDALLAVGGVATDSLTEDIHTTLRLHRLGWQTVYHNEVLAHGLAARNAMEYQVQRFRWGTGAMQLIRRERPFTRPGLTLVQRLSYAATLLGWFDAWRTLGYLLLPIVTLITGELPIRAHLLTFATIYLATNLLQRLSIAALSRGLAPQGVATVFEVIRLPANLRATLTLFVGTKRGFQVTPKGRSDRTRFPVPPLISILIVSYVLALLWFAASMLGWTTLDYEQRGAAIATALFGVANLTVLTVAAHRIRSARFAGNRRRGERFSFDADGRLEDQPVDIVDISLTGASVTTTADQPANSGKLTLTLEGDETTFAVIERIRRPISPPGTVQIGVEFVKPTRRQLGALSRSLFQAGEPAEVSSETDAADPISAPMTRPELSEHAVEDLTRQAPDPRPAGPVSEPAAGTRADGRPGRSEAESALS